MSEELVEEPKPTNIVKSKVPNTFLSNRGYGLLKADFDIKQLEKFKRDMTVKPFVNTNYGPAAPSFKVYMESNKKLYLPKHYGLKELGEPDTIKLEMGESRDIKFVGSMRPKQQPVVDAYIKACDTDKPYTKASRGGIISVPCGFGKTVIALYLIAQLKRKTLVIVHKEFLVNQWKDRIHQYLPSAKVGFIQASKIDTDDCDIVIGMLQSISMKDYNESIFTDFGFCIIDECHHIAAEVFSRALTKINSYYMLGLSATPKRKDGLTKVFEWYIGPYVYININNTETRPIDTIIVNYTNYSPNYCREEVTNYGKTCIPRMLTNICNFARRTQIIIELILHIIKTNSMRNILILSGRLDHLKEIGKGLKNQNIDDYGFYVGGMKEKQLQQSETKRVILATYAMSSEGMDIPSLNTLILASPMSSIEQSVGRILRKDHENLVPLVYDITDNFSVFINQGKKRQQFYRRKNFGLYSSIVNDDNSISNQKLLQLVLDKKKAEPKKRASKKAKTGCLIIDD